MLPRQRKSTCKAERYGQGPDQDPIRMQRYTARRPRLYLPASPEVSLLTNCYQACLVDCSQVLARPNDAHVHVNAPLYPPPLQRCTARRPRLYLPTSPEVSLLTNCYQACFVDCSQVLARPNDAHVHANASLYPPPLQRCTARSPRLYLPASPEVSLLTNCYQACFVDCSQVLARPNDAHVHANAPLYPPL